MTTHTTQPRQTRTQEEPMDTLLEQASPRPWEVHGTRIYYRGPGNGSDVVAENEMLDRNKGLLKVNQTGRAGSWEADAELIVRAVNAYQPLVEALQEIEALQPQALAYLRANGFVMDAIGPLADDASELDRWKVLAFSLYTDLCQANFTAERALATVESSPEGEGGE